MYMNYVVNFFNDLANTFNAIKCWPNYEVNTDIFTSNVKTPIYVL